MLQNILWRLLTAWRL